MTKPWQSCKVEGTYATLLALSIVFFFLYTIGIPALFGILLYKYRNSINSPETSSLLGFFYVNYNPKYYYTEIFWLLRNFALAASFNLAPEIKSLQGSLKYKERRIHIVAILVQLILLLSIIGNYYLSVFQYFLENLMHLVAIVILLVCYNASLWTNKIDTATAWVCYVLMFSYVGVVIIMIVKTKLYELRNKA